jgi:hypothetical protein
MHYNLRLNYTQCIRAAKTPQSSADLFNYVRGKTSQHVYKVMIMAVLLTLTKYAHTTKERTQFLKIRFCFVVHFTVIDLKIYSSQDSSVGIATGYGLDGPGIESR